MLLSQYKQAIVAVFFVLGGAAHAAEISIRSGGSERVDFPFDTPQYVYIEGEIVEGDYEKFKSVASELIIETSSVLEVMVNSSGGDGNPPIFSGVRL